MTAGGTTTCTITNTFNGYATSATTQVLDEKDTDVTNTAVPLGTKVHDTIAVSGRLAGLSLGGTNTVDFKLFSGDNCGVDSGSQIYPTETVDITDNGDGLDGTAESAERARGRAVLLPRELHR